MATTTQTTEKVAPQGLMDHNEKKDTAYEQVEKKDDSSNELHHVNTLGVDKENHEAEKGDDSDGKVNWTWKQILATIFLSALYVGKSAAPALGLH